MRYLKRTSQRRVIRRLAAVALSTFICWAPFHLQRLLAIYGKTLDNPSDTFYLAHGILTHLSGVLYFLSTAINPILYNIMSKKFRNAFKVTYTNWCSRRRRGNDPRFGRTHIAMLASQRLGNGAALEPSPHRCRWLSSATTDLLEAPPRPEVTYTNWRGRRRPRNDPRFGRTHIAMLASQRLENGAALEPSPHRCRWLSSATTDLLEAPPRPGVRSALLFVIPCGDGLWVNTHMTTLLLR
ncbi:unnamed protein product [Chilo suppressalis]|uniref:G-protein coupled receptors family 1 profile domain-containing protein n=1 Tax=Chilo suppressalis TaxID=168631 RepID=A0ABN8EDY2_CHISP|nr:unnamed protein product [Chilo suppressalis]